jgi:hypothetical protein
VALTQLHSASKRRIEADSVAICGKSGLETHAFGLVCFVPAAFSLKNL